MDDFLYGFKALNNQYIVNYYLFVLIYRILHAVLFMIFYHEKYDILDVNSFFAGDRECASGSWMSLSPAQTASNFADI